MKSTQTGDHMVSGAQVRRTLAATVQDQKLVSDQHRLGDHTPEPSGHCQPDDCDNQMKQKDEEIAHLGNRTKVSQASDFTSDFEFARDRS